jgi:hypothetical protein
MKRPRPLSEKFWTSTGYYLSTVSFWAISDKYHRHDPLYPNSVLNVAKLLEDPNLEKGSDKHQKILREVKLAVALIIHDSPYAEVSRGVYIVSCRYSSLLNSDRFAPWSLRKMIRTCRVVPFEPGRSGWFSLALGPW